MKLQFEDRREMMQFLLHKYRDEAERTSAEITEKQQQLLALDDEALEVLADLEGFYDPRE